VLSSSIRNSTQRNKILRYHTNEGDISKKNILDIASLRDQVVEQIDKINDNFEDY